MRRHLALVGAAVATWLVAGTTVADEAVLAAEPVFGFGAEWAHVEGSGAAADAAMTLGSEGDAAAWALGRSPFVGRSALTHREAQSERRRIQRSRRRRGRSALPDFEGTYLVYDSEVYAAATGPAEDYEPGPNLYTFTRTFELTDVASVASVFLEIRFSGGFVAFINGREWVRHNVDVDSPDEAPADIVWQPHWVAQTVGNVWQRAFVGLDPSHLVEGTNQVTVEVRRRGHGGSRALYYDAQLRVYRDNGFIRTPYLQNVDQHSVTVMWETTVPSVGYVEFGAGDQLDRVATSPRAAATIQEVTLTNLQPDRRYFYRVHSLPAVPAYEAEPVTSAIYHFRTGVGPGTPFTFIAYGDNRTNSETHARLVQQMLADAERHDVRFFLNTGDLTTNGSWWDQWQDEFFVPALPMLAYYPMYAVLGNHEGNHETYYEYLDLPNNEAWYSFRYGDAEFFGLNSSTQFQPGSDQYNWLEGALAASSARWKVAFFHHPPFSCVPSRKPGNAYVVEYLVPLFETYGVDLVLLGHDHLYGRSVPVNGVIYVISGGGGASTYPAEPDEVNEICVQVHHYCILRVTEHALEVEAVTIEGELLDRFSLGSEPEF